MRARQGLCVEARGCSWHLGGAIPEAPLALEVAAPPLPGLCGVSAGRPALLQISESTDCAWAPTGSGSAGLQGRPAPCSLQAPVEPELRVQGPCSEQQQLVLPGFLSSARREACSLLSRHRLPRSPLKPRELPGLREALFC